MPNHVKHRFMIIAKDEEQAETILNSFKGKAIKSYDKNFDFTFNTIIPEPDSISNTEDGTDNYLKLFVFLSEKNTLSLEEIMLNIKRNIYYEETDYKNAINLNIAEHIQSDFYEFSKIVSEMNEKEVDSLYDKGKVYAENLREYGAMNWYDWRVKHWGTKWDAFDTDMFRINNIVTVTFSTAWACCQPIIEAICKKFNDCTVECDYADEDYGYNCGIMIYSGTELTIETFKDGTLSALKFASDVWDDTLAEFCENHYTTLEELCFEYQCSIQKLIDTFTIWEVHNAKRVSQDIAKQKLEE